MEIRGYAYEPGISIDTADTRLLAYDPAAGVYYRLPTENVKKKKQMTALIMIMRSLSLLCARISCRAAAGRVSGTAVMGQIA